MNARTMLISLLVLVSSSSLSLAQFQRRGFGGRGVSVMSLLRIDEVQDALKLSDEQTTQLRSISEKYRGQRGDRANFRDMTDEERDAYQEEQRKKASVLAAEAKQAVNALLDDQQRTRLQQVFVQVAGSQALDDADVATALSITDEQKTQIKATRDEVMDDMRSEMRELFQSGDRELMREKMIELRASSEARILAQLTEAQRTQLDELKGELLDIPRSALFGRGRSGGGRRERDSDRPKRPQRPE